MKVDQQLRLFGRFAVHEVLAILGFSLVFGGSRLVHMGVEALKASNAPTWQITVCEVTEGALLAMGVGFIVMSSFMAISRFLSSMKDAAPE